MRRLQITNVLTNIMSSGFSIEMYKEGQHYVIDLQLDEDTYETDTIASNNFSGHELAEVLTKLAQSLVKRRTSNG